MQAELLVFITPLPTAETHAFQRLHMIFFLIDFKNTMIELIN